ncbi:hypothetical protein [Rhizobium rhizogenes]|uniref:hypothetical protein n=1 Tax=Rhizobium rhizogenes TaxID=359 RepID=UPI0022C86DF6|nr:hypothetical protein [Rhizobium rhizogenes]MCZ7464141.1 hypothetical protein [Rhizobium rhizogenes]
MVLTPHIGTATHETRLEMGALVLANIDAHLAGKDLPTPVAQAISPLRAVMRQFCLFAGRTDAVSKVALASIIHTSCLLLQKKSVLGKR